jgi:glycosyltransferase involved in cell wall biosynthesis
MRNRNVTFSVVIPAYNSARTICRAVDSVISQTVPAHEIIVVDDGSRDELEGALRPYGPRVQTLRKQNGGAASARNLGIDVATGTVIAFLDADDCWEPQKLARQAAVFQNHPEVAVVGSCYYERSPGGERRLAVTTGIPLDQVLTFKGNRAFDLAYQLFTTTVAIQKDILGTMRFDTTLTTAEDRDLWIRLVSEFPVYLMAEPLATAVLEPHSLSRTDVDRDYSNMLRVVHRHRALLGADDLRRRETDIYRRWAGVLMSEGKYGPAVQAAWRRLERRPLDPFAWWALTKSAVLNVTWPRHPRVPAG